jgi:hypothetical protein
MPRAPLEPVCRTIEMTIRWVMKTAPKRKPVPASAEDVVAGPDPKLPVSLSPKAIAEGWRGVA